jgi:hypothetical protein
MPIRRSGRPPAVIRVTTAKPLKEEVEARRDSSAKGRDGAKSYLRGWDASGPPTTLTARPKLPIVANCRLRPSANQVRSSSVPPNEKARWTNANHADTMPVTAHDAALVGPPPDRLKGEVRPSLP